MAGRIPATREGTEPRRRRDTLRLRKSRVPRRLSDPGRAHTAPQGRVPGRWSSSQAVPGGKTASSRRFVERLPRAPEWPSKPSGASDAAGVSRSSGLTRDLWYAHSDRDLPHFSADDLRHQRKIFALRRILRRIQAQMPFPSAWLSGVRPHRPHSLTIDRPLQVNATSTGIPCTADAAARTRAL